MRKTLPITTSVRKQLECRGLALETAFVDDVSPETMVMVFRVEPLPGTRPTNTDIVKFSESRYAISNAARIQLGTHRYYRKYEGEGEGIRDEMEGRFQKDMSNALLRRMGISEQSSTLSAQATMGVEDQWLFCASLVPRGFRSSSLGQLGRKLGYECGTQVLDPGAFACELGAIFAIHTSWDDVQLAGHHKVLQLLASVTDIKRTIFVYHGPVSYPAEAAKVVHSFPERHRSAIAPFQKRPDYEWQQEYRFVFSFLGEPQAQTVLLPINAELRSLAGMVWEDLERRER